MTGIIAAQYQPEKMTFVSCTLENIFHLRRFIMMSACLIPGPRPSAVPVTSIDLIISGTKIWTLIPPEFAKFLTNPHTSALPKSVDSTDPQFPDLEKAREVGIRVSQYPGETIFVPSGWYHQVVNQGYTPLYPIADKIDFVTES